MTAKELQRIYAKVYGSTAPKADAERQRAALLAVASAVELEVLGVVDSFMDGYNMLYPE